MKSLASSQFWKYYQSLPPEIRQKAEQAFLHWQLDPYHPALQFKQVDPNEPLYSVRVGRGYRALGWMEGNTVTWFWIGSHADYDHLIK
jgi:hypothetical protein